MQLAGKVAIVTGGARGIGLALCRRFVAEGATVILSDHDPEIAHARAHQIGATAVVANVAAEDDVAALVATASERFGRIDLFCSNAGSVSAGGERTPIEQWRTEYEVNLLAHVWAAKYVLPQMLARGDGYLLNVVSAAGLLTEFDSAPDTVTRHAAVGLAEWLAVTYAARGIKVSILCPGAVTTPDIGTRPTPVHAAISVEQVADDVIEALAQERFLISTHAYVTELFRLKATDYQRYLATMETQRRTWDADIREAGPGAVTPV